MDVAQINDPVSRKPLRVWPGVLALAVQWLAWFIVPVFLPEKGPYGIFVGLVAGLGVVLWWLFFSRAPWLERLGVIVLMVVAIIATKRIVHESIANGGMGMILYIYAVPILCLALVAATAVGGRLATPARRATIVCAILFACGGFTLVRTGGITGEGDADIHWRWTPTPEERLLSQQASEDSPSPLVPLPRQEGEKTAPPAPAAPQVAAAWPGFRGPKRDGIVRGVRIETNWSASPPVELWRRPIGPGWSSFAVQGDLLHTQEQRGQEEMVSCYRVSTGEFVWTHSDATRFWESNAGAGPRATPTLDNGRLYTLGGTGILNVLNARTGALVWSRNTASDTGGKLPHWGFSSSPLVVGDLVIVYAGALAAYDRPTGEPRWVGEPGGVSYSSPHPVTLHGVDQILQMKGAGLISVAPADGALLWEYSWQSGIVQPAFTAEGDILISAIDEMGGQGMRRIAVRPDTVGWTIEERWTSRGLKPYFNDFVVHQGHAYGFDNSILACIDLADGERKWKGGRYGHGQLVLLANQDVLLVLSEKGRLALVSATPDQFTELATFPAIEGKTWNHPVLTGDILLVRNDHELAAFRLTLASGFDATQTEP